MSEEELSQYAALRAKVDSPLKELKENPPPTQPAVSTALIVNYEDCEKNLSTDVIQQTVEQAQQNHGTCAQDFQKGV